MNNSFSLILISITLFILFITIIIFLNLLMKGLLEPNLSLSEILKKIELNNLKYIGHKKISKKEFEIHNGIEIKKNLIKLIYFRDSYFELITYSKENKKFKLFWVKKTKCIGFNFLITNFLIELLIGESLNKIIGTKYIEEKNIEKLKKIQTEYNYKIVLINSVCPACGTQVEKTDLKCNECGLNLNS